MFLDDHSFGRRNRLQVVVSCVANVGLGRVCHVIHGLHLGLIYHLSIYSPVQGAVLPEQMLVPKQSPALSCGPWIDQCSLELLLGEVILHLSEVKGCRQGAIFGCL